jgi:hypothetical protein
MLLTEAGEWPRRTGRPRHRLTRVIALGLTFWLAVGGALAQRREPPPVYPDPPGQGPALPFVGEDGLGQKVLTLSQVADRLGAPERVDAPPEVRATRSGGYRVWHYPERGLRFHVNREDNDGSDPRVAYMEVQLPFDGRTPLGLYLGMPQAEALPLIEARYRVRTRTPTHGEGPKPIGLYVTVSNAEGRRAQDATFRFHNGLLRSMSFQLKPRPWIPVKDQEKMTSLLVLLGLLAVGGWLMGRLREGMGRTWHWAQLALGGALGLMGVVLLVGAISALGEGGGWAILLGPILGVGGVVALAVGGLQVQRALRHLRA